MPFRYFLLLGFWGLLHFGGPCLMCDRIKPVQDVQFDDQSRTSAEYHWKPQKYACYNHYSTWRVSLFPYIYILYGLTRKVGQPPAIYNSSSVKSLQRTNRHDAVHPIVGTAPRCFKLNVRKVFHLILGEARLPGVVVVEFDAGPRSEEATGLDEDVVAIIGSNSVTRVEFVVNLRWSQKIG